MIIELTDRERRFMAHVLLSLTNHIRDEMEFWNTQEPPDGYPDLRGIVRDREHFWELYNNIVGFVDDAIEAIGHEWLANGDEHEEVRIP
jgi:hypothetical protein